MMVAIKLAVLFLGWCLFLTLSLVALWLFAKLIVWLGQQLVGLIDFVYRKFKGNG